MPGKKILLAGASGGIGSQLVPMFVDDLVIQHYHHNEPKSDGFKIKADITNYEEVQRMANKILEEIGPIDILINTTGVSIEGFAHKIEPEIWEKVINVNLIGSFNLIRAVLPQMRNNNFGRIINMASIVFQRPVLGTSAYSASKAALVGLTRTVALENSNKGITCNCIALGYYDAGILYQIPEDLREGIRENIPMKRFGKINEIYKTIEYLINMDYITGQLISPNGGLYMY